jgi:hypothetical protein
MKTSLGEELATMLTPKLTKKATNSSTPDSDKLIVLLA